MPAFYLSQKLRAEEDNKFRDDEITKWIRSFYFLSLIRCGQSTATQPKDIDFRFIRLPKRDFAHRFLVRIRTLFFNLTYIQQEIFKHEVLFGANSYLFWYEGQFKYPLIQANRIALLRLLKVFFTFKRRTLNEC